jgi:hypothetical protein
MLHVGQSALLANVVHFGIVTDREHRSRGRHEAGKSFHPFNLTRWGYGCLESGRILPAA